MGTGRDWDGRVKTECLDGYGGWEWGWDWDGMAIKELRVFRNMGGGELGVRKSAHQMSAWCGVVWCGVGVGA